MASRPDLIFATGRSDYPNQINNVLGFPYIFRGALDCGASVINEAMKLAAVRAIARLAKEPVPSVVNAAYNMNRIEFGRDYILPKPLDPRLLTWVSPAVAKGAMESGVARRPITDWDAYEERLRKLMGYDKKFLRRIYDKAKEHPKRVVFGEANTDNMLRAAVMGAKEGAYIPVLLGNEEMIQKRADRLGLDIAGIEIVNLRHDREESRRKRYAAEFAARRQRRGVTLPEALEKMFDRNYFGMMMVQTGDADAFLGGTYSGAHDMGQIAREVVGIRPSHNSFAALHIINTKRGTFFISDTLVNKNPDTETLTDIARLTRNSVEYFAETPVMAMVSFSNFGASDDKECRKVQDAVNLMHERYPELAIDGEMTINYALNTELRDKVFPFNRLSGKDVNTLIFPNLASASTAYRMMLEMGVAESVGPIQMGLNKPVHFASVHAPVRDIVNIAVIAGLDAAVLERSGGSNDK